MNIFTLNIFFVTFFVQINVVFIHFGLLGFSTKTIWNLTGGGCNWRQTYNCCAPDQIALTKWAVGIFWKCYSFSKICFHCYCCGVSVSYHFLHLLHWKKKLSLWVSYHFLHFASSPLNGETLWFRNIFDKTWIHSHSNLNYFMNVYTV